MQFRAINAKQINAVEATGLFFAPFHYMAYQLFVNRSKIEYYWVKIWGFRIERHGWASRTFSRAYTYNLHFKMSGLIRIRSLRSWLGQIRAIFGPHFWIVWIIFDLPDLFRFFGVLFPVESNPILEMILKLIRFFRVRKRMWNDALK